MEQLSNKYLRFTYLLLVLSTLALSCSKKIKTDDQAMSKKLMISALENHNFDYTMYSSNANIDIISEQMNIGVNAQFRVKNNGPIWFVGKKFGFEIARGLIAKDTIKVIDRFNKRYAISPVNELEKITGISDILAYANSYLVGNIVIPISKDKEVTIGSLSSTIEINKDKIYQYILNNTDKSVSEMSVLDGNKILNIKYLSYQKIGNYLVPNKYEISATEDGVQKMKLKINLSNIDLISSKSMPFDIPNGYKLFKI